jgi:hypothetical protein
MTDSDVIRAAGGLLAPLSLEPFTVTYRVRYPWRRWWHRRHGWSTEWTVEYDPRDYRVRDVIPVFTATRGGVSVLSTEKS